MKDIDYDKLIKQRIRQALVDDCRNDKREHFQPKPTKRRGARGVFFLLPFLIFGLMIRRVRKKEKE